MRGVTTARLGLRQAPRFAVRSGYLSLATLAFACSVYEASDVESQAIAGSGAVENGGTSNAGGTANGGVTTGPASGSGGMPSAGSAGSGTSSGGMTSVGSAGAAGEMSASGGEGGMPSEVDLCPDDPDKLAPGACGCGVPDVATPALADCHSLKSKLVHRYDFEGTGTKVVDRVGTAHGVIARGASLSNLEGRGVVLLGGGDVGSYVDLPNGLISSLTNATLESWITWGGGGAWQRIFDFGDSTAANPENAPDNGKTYLFATPSSASGVALTGFSVLGNSAGQELQAKSAAPLSTSLSQVVVVANADADKLMLYVNGVKVAQQGWTGALSGINDVNVWLGRSQYIGDPELNAVFHEFRIYKAALSDAEVAASYKGGTDPSYLAY